MHEFPNQRHIDHYEERIQELTNFEEIRDMDVSDLQNLRDKIDWRLFHFKHNFPGSDCRLEKSDLQLFYGDTYEGYEPLRDDEINELRMIQLKARRNIDRAIGLIKEKRREQRFSLLENSINLLTQIVKFGVTFMDLIIQFAKRIGK